MLSNQNKNRIPLDTGWEGEAPFTGDLNPWQQKQFDLLLLK